MTDMNVALGTNLFYRLEKLRQEKGTVTAEDAGTIVAQLMQSGNRGVLEKEIVQMIRDLEAAKREMLALSSDTHTNKQAISDASLHLDTVVKSTETATNSVMDAASAIAAISEEIGGEKGQALQDICTGLYEACNFQDLVSQRVVKVTKLIRVLEDHIANLLKLFAISEDALGHAATSNREQLGDRALLNGPALPNNSVSQDDIDALFKSLGE